MARIPILVWTLVLAAIAPRASAEIVHHYWGSNESGILVGAVADYSEEVPRYLPAMFSATDADPVVLANQFGGYAMGINAGNEIVGGVFDESGSQLSAALWRNGEILVLADLGEGAVANAIDDAGVIYGVVVLDGLYLSARWVDFQLEWDPYVPPVYEEGVPDGSGLDGDSEFYMSSRTDGDVGGNELSTLGVIPAPGALAVLGLAGVAASRRRR